MEGKILRILAISGAVGVPIFLAYKITKKDRDGLVSKTHLSKIETQLPQLKPVSYKLKDNTALNKTKGKDAKSYAIDVNIIKVGDGESLNSKEEKKFFVEIEFLYSVGKGLVDQEIRGTMLSNLNSRYSRGVNSILKTLSTSAKSTKELDLNIKLVDYLCYRLKFDEKLRDVVPDIIDRDRWKFDDERDEAIVIAENAEILERLAAIHIEQSLSVLASRQDSISQRIYAKYIFRGLKKTGVSDSEAILTIQEVIPDFQG